MLARFFVWLYRLVHGRLGLPGSGVLLRSAARVVPELQSFPLAVPEVGTALVDFRDCAAFSLFNFALGEADNHGALVQAMARHLPARGVLWDIGANVGLISAHFSRADHKLSAILAFEPVPGPLRTIQSLFAGHAVVQVHPLGLGAKNERLTIHYCPHSSSLNSVSRPVAGTVPVEIQIRRGDDLRAELKLPAPHVIKIDVEGFEPEVFAGLEKTITEARPVIFYEHIMLTDEQVRALVPAGYSLLFLLEDGRLVEDFALRMQGHNAVLLPPGSQPRA